MLSLAHTLLGPALDLDCAPQERHRSGSQEEVPALLGDEKPGRGDESYATISPASGAALALSRGLRSPVWGEASRDGAQLWGTETRWPWAWEPKCVQPPMGCDSAL